MDEPKYDMRKLHGIVKALSDTHVVKVGIFGGTRSNAAKPKPLSFASLGKKSTLTNAEIGAIHEFGSMSGGVPMRSFLRMPLDIKQKEIAAQGLVGMEALLAANKPLDVLKRIGIACENVVQLAFSSGGFGFWRFLSPVTVKRKGSSRELIDTGQLRRSITSRVGTPS